MTSARRCIPLDRDGVINVDRPYSVTRVEDLVDRGTAFAIAKLCRAGYHVLVETNQVCVARVSSAVRDSPRSMSACVSGSMRPVDASITSSFARCRRRMRVPQAEAPVHPRRAARVGLRAMRPGSLETLAAMSKRRLPQAANRR
jgi:hypothetical protein